MIHKMFLLVFMSLSQLFSLCESAEWSEQRFSGRDFFEEEFSHGWIRVCKRSGENFETKASQCPKGVFLKEPFVPGCVCMQGTWVLHSSICDSSPYVFYGEIEQEQCYQIDFLIQAFIYLGDPLDIFASRTYVAPHSLTVFHEINSSWSPQLDFQWPSIISLNGARHIEAKEAGSRPPLCFSNIESIPKKKKIKAHIWDSGLGPTAYRIIDSCVGKQQGGFDDLVGTFKEFYYRSNKAIPIPAVPCNSQCVRASSTSTTTEPTTTLLWNYKIKGNKSSNVFDTFKKKRGVEDGEYFNQELKTEKILKREKRFKIRDAVDTTWDGIAFCMKSYWDPILKFEMETPDEKHCFPHNNGIYTEPNSKNI